MSYYKNNYIFPISLFLLVISGNVFAFDSTNVQSTVQDRSDATNVDVPNWYTGLSAHSINEIPFPSPVFEVGVESKNIGGRLLVPFFGAGRIGMELYSPKFSSPKLSPYLTYGRSYYVVGSDTFIGIGTEYHRTGKVNIIRLELTRIGLKPVSDDTEFDPRYVITIGFGHRY